MSLFVKSFPLGSVVRLTAEFTDAAGVAVTPGTVTVRTYDPALATVSRVYGTDVTVEMDGTGLYHCDIAAALVGKWQYRWEGTDPAQAVAEGSFTVPASVFA